MRQLRKTRSKPETVEKRIAEKGQVVCHDEKEEHGKKKISAPVKKY